MAGIQFLPIFGGVGRGNKGGMGGFGEVETVRCSKTINMRVRSRTEEQAKKMVLKICTDLRIYNPVVSECVVNIVPPDNLQKD